MGMARTLLGFAQFVNESRSQCFEPSHLNIGRLQRLQRLKSVASGQDLFIVQKHRASRLRLAAVSRQRGLQGSRQSVGPVAVRPPALWRKFVH